MSNFILTVMGKWGYIGICFLIAIENIFPPIPSEVILTFGGFLTINTSLNPIGVIISSTIGSLIGAIILYYLGYNVRKLKFIKIKDEDIKKANESFNKKGNNAVLFCRFVPIVRSLISIPAGLNKMNMGKFLLLTTIGSAIWNTVLVYAGVFLGDNWTIFANIIKRYSKVVLVLIILFIIIKIWVKINCKSRNC